MEGGLILVLKGAKLAQRIELYLFFCFSVRLSIRQVPVGAPLSRLSWVSLTGKIPVEQEMHEQLKEKWVPIDRGQCRRIKECFLEEVNSPKTTWLISIESGLEARSPLHCPVSL